MTTPYFKRALRGAIAAAVASVLMVGAPTAFASSHREAPAITKSPKVDTTDFYMFRSYEPGRQDYVTMIANYQPLQDAYGGPNYFNMDSNALYEFHVDNNADGVEDITFQFNFTNTLGNGNQGLSLNIDGTDVAVPLTNIGQLGVGNDAANQNLVQTYDVTMVTGDRRKGNSTLVGTFTKPSDNIGAKSIPPLNNTPQYVSYAKSVSNSAEIYNNATATACPAGAQDIRVFAGQRKESFAVNLGEIFDLVNLNPVGPVNGQVNDLANKNITTLAIEVPIACLNNNGATDVIGGWSSASLRQVRVLDPEPDHDVDEDDDDEIVGGPYTQVSRLGMPLVNEVVIGLPDKDKFNASEPKNDAQFAAYVTNPTLPALLNALFPIVTAPTNFPRTDLVGAFLQGIPTINETPGLTAEMVRLNVVTPLPTPLANQSNLGVLGNDFAGFPNGRRPGDDVVDIALRVSMGALCHPPLVGVFCNPADAPSGTLAYTDGVEQLPTQFDNAFPYLTTPVAGSPN